MFKQSQVKKWKIGFGTNFDFVIIRVEDQCQSWRSLYVLPHCGCNDCCFVKRLFKVDLKDACLVVVFCVSVKLRIRFLKQLPLNLFSNFFIKAKIFFKNRNDFNNCFASPLNSFELQWMFTWSYSHPKILVCNYSQFFQNYFQISNEFDCTSVSFNSNHLFAQFLL